MFMYVCHDPPDTRFRELYFQHLKRGRVNILDEDSRTPLYQACLMGSLPMAKMLLAADADPNRAGRGSSLRPQTEEEMEDGAAKVRGCCCPERNSSKITGGSITIATP